jgi:hypothetical protein
MTELQAPLHEEEAVHQVAGTVSIHDMSCTIVSNVICDVEYLTYFLILQIYIIIMNFSGMPNVLQLTL